MKNIYLCFLLFLLTPHALASSKLVTAADVQEILNIARGFGSATLGVDGIGDPKITGRIDGVRYNIYFYGCNDDNENCKSVTFRSGWSGSDVSLSDVNSWNTRKRFGTAYLDDGDIMLKMPVNLDHGLSYSNFEDTIDWWSITLTQFRDDVVRD